jgi:CubicO group peptidase (beta-lactamase class C family)
VSRRGWSGYSNCGFGLGPFAGAVVLAATEEKVLALEACGYADLATKKPMATDSLFWIASMTKPMTCTALMILVDEGKANVDDPVEKYLPEFKGQMMIGEKDDEQIVSRKPAHPIKVSEVMNPTSGLAFSCAMETPTFDQLRLRDSVRAHAICRCNSSRARTRWVASSRS